MHDWKVTGQERYGLLALENHKEYRQLKQILGSYSTGDKHSFEIQYGAGYHGNLGGLTCFKCFYIVYSITVPTFALLSKSEKFSQILDLIA